MVPHISYTLYAPLFSDLYQSNYQIISNNIVLNNTNNSTDASAIIEDENEIDITYAAFEILVAIIAVIGNLMVVIVFKKDRKLRRRTNYYIVSLAVADLLVGLFGVPFAILSSIGLPKQKYACLFSLSTLIILCTISIFCLVAVSVDRYWAILYPMAYSRNVRTKTAIGIISVCWFLGTLIGLLPLVIHQNYKDNCYFEQVMDYNYLLFLYFATIITPALLLLAFYAHIYQVIVRQIRQIVTMNPLGESSRRSSVMTHNSISAQQKGYSCRGQGGTMLRVLGAARKRDVKATQNLSIIVLFFMICWIPLYTINAITAFNQSIDIHIKLKMFCIILTHLNSAVNPILYAYHLKDFRAALKALILKIFGIETQQTSDFQYRLSVASQHRLQSLSDKRTSTQNRIYIDSPVWLKQQQLKRNSALTNSIHSIHKTATVVATDDMWKIVEVPSTGANNDDSESKTKSLARNYNTSNNKHSSGSLSQFLYENKNYSSSLDDLDDIDDLELDRINDFGGIDDDVFLPNDSTSSTPYPTVRKSIATIIKEKLSESVSSYDLEKHNNNDNKPRKSIESTSVLASNTFVNGSFTFSQHENNSNSGNSVYHITTLEIPISTSASTPSTVSKYSKTESLNKLKKLTRSSNKYLSEVGANSISCYTQKQFDSGNLESLGYKNKYFQQSPSSSAHSTFSRQKFSKNKSRHSSLYEIYNDINNKDSSFEIVVPDSDRPNDRNDSS